MYPKILFIYAVQFCRVMTEKSHFRSCFMVPKMFQVKLLSIFILYVLSGNLALCTKPHVQLESAIGYQFWPEEQLKMYAILEKLSLQNPYIENLNDYIFPFLSHHCLVFVDKFGPYTEASVGTNPVILRRLDPLVITSTKQMILGPVNLSKRNITVTDNLYKCPFSSLFDIPGTQVGYEYSSNNFTGAICFHLNTHRYALRSKSWNCNVKVGLFTERYTEYLKLLQVEGSISGSTDSFPTFGTPLTIIFVEEEKTRMADYRTESLRYDFCDSNFITFFSFSIHINTLKYGSVDWPPLGTVKDVRLITKCMQQNVYIPIKKHEITDFNTLHNLALAETSDDGYKYIPWNIHTHVDFGEAVFSYMFRFLDRCGKSKDMLRNQYEPVQHVGRAYASIWISIMGNRTLRDWETICENGIEVEENDGRYRYKSITLHLLPYLRGYQYFPYFVQDRLSTLRFVSCGKPGYNPFAFEELTNIFDTWIWSSILFAIVVVAILLKIQSGSVDNVRAILISMKVLLEQGDNGVNDKRVRCSVGWYILMGIVLSNAYKNTNIYNIISPRNPIPYEKMEQLISDKFTVYTRVIYLDVSLPDLMNSSEVLNQYLIGGGSIAGVDQNDLLVIAVSEVAAAMRAVVEAIINMQSRERVETQFQAISEIAIVKSGVRNGAALQSNLEEHINISHQKILEILYTYVSEAQFDFADLFVMTQAVIQQQLTKLKEYDSEFLRKTFFDCKNVALILPENMCQDYLKKAKAGNIPHVFVGKELYSEVECSFSLKGAIPLSITKRIKSIREGGIWERWTNLIISAGPTPVANVVAAAKMDGNIIIIYFILLLGLTLSLLVAIIEFRGIVWSTIDQLSVLSFLQKDIRTYPFLW